MHFLPVCVFTVIGRKLLKCEETRDSSGHEGCRENKKTRAGDDDGDGGNCPVRPASVACCKSTVARYT